MKTIRVTHTTVYRYSCPVRFGEHRMMFRPRDSHDMDLIDTKMVISPPAEVRWVHDVFGNSIAYASFADEADQLRFESEILLQHFPYTAPAFQIDPAAEVYPFQYPADDMPDLMPSIMRRYPDADKALEQWVKQFYEGTPVGTLKLLSAMTHAIKAQFSYRAREQMGTQMPAETIASGSGTCRDYALLMIEALRTLGFASRFVSGYLYDAAADVSPNGMVGGAATHAWVQVYVPGAGWMEFDPTNGIIGGENLIRIAVTRSPSQSIPVQGTFAGPSNAFIGMDVDVQVVQAEEAAR
ncbi:MAG: transglutaminase family protein [Rhodospirillales bacterium]|nr:transglutaminase family protein [Rhodospirillales bacterium]